MAVDPSSFHALNVTDTCAAWNVLSSATLYQVARRACVEFCCTRFVHFECLLKARTRVTAEDEELRDRFRAVQGRGDFSVYDLEVADLQVLQILELRKRLGKGELSSIVFAMKTRQAFLTDDQKARRLADEVMTTPGVQTTPHLFGWLFFCDHLTDADKERVITEHAAMGRPLAKFFDQMYEEALRCRLMASQRVMDDTDAMQ